jgi:DNA-binding NarL/FixJ family response regulator
MVVDDHDFCRDALIDLLDSEPDIEVVAEGSDGTDASTWSSWSAQM